MSCKILVENIVVDYDVCSKCGLCYKYCPTKALYDRGDGAPSPVVHKCIACLGCMALCSDDAIRLSLKSVCPE